MKATIAAALLAIILASCTSTRNLEAQRAEISWAAFCAARGYAIDDNTYQATNEYLDTWSGTVEEEAALIAAGVEPY